MRAAAPMAEGAPAVRRAAVWKAAAEPAAEGMAGVA